jgi:two-component system, OmpR family, sensor kinase
VVAGPSSRDLVGPPDAAGPDADPALETLVASIRHEVRAPLAVVRVAAETIRNRGADLDPETFDEIVGGIVRNADLALQLIDRLALALTPGSPTETLEVEAVDLDGVVREAVSDLGSSILAEHSVEVASTGEVPVLADPVAVREIVFNLLSNAAKYSPPETEIEVDVAQNRDHAEVIVRDQGEGVPAAAAERIFDRFAQLEPDEGGMGLGLFIARKLARAHGGDLVVRPQPGRGGEFVLTVPSPGPAGHDDGPSRPYT